MALPQIIIDAIRENNPAIAKLKIEQYLLNRDDFMSLVAALLENNFIENVKIKLSGEAFDSRILQCQTAFAALQNLLVLRKKLKIGLDLSGCERISPEDLRALLQMPLESLNIASSQHLGSDIIQHGPANLVLENLNISGVILDRGKIERFVSKFPALKTLSLHRADERIFRVLPAELKALEILDGSNLKAEELSSLANRHLTQLSIRKYKNSGAQAMQVLLSLQELESLNITGSRIWDGEVFSLLTQLPSLSKLDISETAINGSGLEQALQSDATLAQRLRSLNLAMCPNFSNANLVVALAQLTSLESLNLMRCSVDNLVMDEVAQALPVSLRSLNLGMNPNVNNDILRIVVERCRGLRDLNLFLLPQINSNSLRVLAGLPLESLGIASTSAGNEGVLLFENHPTMTSLNLNLLGDLAGEVRDRVEARIRENATIGYLCEEIVVPSLLSGEVVSSAALRCFAEYPLQMRAMIALMPNQAEIFRAIDIKMENLMDGISFKRTADDQELPHLPRELMDRFVDPKNPQKGILSLSEGSGLLEAARQIKQEETDLKKSMNLSKGDFLQKLNDRKTPANWNAVTKALSVQDIVDILEDFLLEKISTGSAETHFEKLDEALSFLHASNDETRVGLQNHDKYEEIIFSLTNRFEEKFGVEYAMMIFDFCQRNAPEKFGGQDFEGGEYLEVEAAATSVSAGVGSRVLPPVTKDHHV